MKGLYIEVPKMTVLELQAFVQEHMLTPKKLMATARKRKIPRRCPECKEKLEDFIDAYERIPSTDKTIFFEEVDGTPRCTQWSSGCCAGQIKSPLRRIVQRHIAKKLRDAGYKCKLYEV